MQRSQSAVSKQSRHSGRKTSEPPDSSSGGATNANNGASSSSNAPSRRLTRHKMDIVVKKPEVSPEFLQCLKTLTRRDFEHASDGDPNPDQVRATNNTPSDRPPTRKAGKTEGFKFFAKNSPPVIYHRPLTAEPGGCPFYTNVDEHLLGRNILRPVSASTPSSSGSGGGRLRALTKSKASPVLQILPRQGEIDVDQVERPLTATTDDCEDDDNSASDSERPSTAGSSKRVTFAADVVNYERENKPSKRRKFPKRKKQGFPHPSRGIFIPPGKEIIESSGPTGICRDNPYLNFNQVWTHPSNRTTEESTEGQEIRQNRFHQLMSDLEHAHIHYNHLGNMKQNSYLTQSIFKRYILVLDLALTEGHLNQVEHLLETISKSIPVLHQNTFFYLYGSKAATESGGNEEPLPKHMEVQNDNPNLLLAGYALARISGNLPRLDSTQMSIETVMVKLCLELIEVVFSPFGCFAYRNALNCLPYTVRQAILLLKALKANTDTSAYLKWINNSAVQRDFRSILKNLGLMDNYGSIDDLSSTNSLGGAAASSKPKKTGGESSSAGGKQDKAV